jgi:PKD repeat protein
MHYMMKNITLSLALLLTSFLFSQAQEKKRCGTKDGYTAEELERDPELKQRLQALESFTRDYMNNPENLKSGSVIVVPVVFHIIHTYGQENISRAQVMDALRVINNDFRKLNADTSVIHASFKGIAADSEIEFRIAQLDPNGNCTDGITRTVSEFTHSAGENVKTLVRWDRKKYLNVWVVKTIASGAGGYAFLPSGASETNDGIVIRNAQFGSIGTSSYGTSRSLTHEIGHYLNLKHTWGGTNNPGLSSNCTDDDEVSDTPNTIGNTSCNINNSTCSSLDNVQNYMEYAFCERMFTQGQKTRMRAALNSGQAYRNQLWTGANHAATGTSTGYSAPPCVPQADFSSNYTMLCTGGTVNFNDLSWKALPTTWSWSFPGGSPSVSADQNPVVQYNTPGIYPVTLTVGTSSGSNTLTKNSLVIVRPTWAYYNIPYSESFENMTTFPNSDYIVINDGGNAWDRTTVAGATGTASLRLVNFSGNVQGKTDVFITPSFDLSLVSNTNLTFKLAHAVRSASGTDQLKVYASSSCGSFWSMRYTQSGTNLSTAGLLSTNFVPTTNQWRTETVNLSSTSFSGQPNVMLKFEYTYDNGNNIYIDDINMDGIVGINDITDGLEGISLYPNPGSTVSTLSMSLKSSGHIVVQLIDALGRVIDHKDHGVMAAGQHKFEISLPYSNGVYQVRITAGQQIVNRKLMVQNN